MNKLEHLSEFERILAQYTVSEAGSALLGQVNLALLVAPTSSGRNTIIRELVKTDRYHYVVSDTTRRPRVNDGVLEQDGVEYWFRSEEDVLNDLREGKFLEAAIIHKQQVSGISLRELEVAKDKGQVAVTDIEIAGIDSIMRVKPDAKAIFVVPPGFDEWQRRIQNRGHMDPHEYKRRLQSAVQEFSHALEQPFYHFVVNDTVENAVRQIEGVVNDETRTRIQSDHVKDTLQRLLKDTEDHLKTM